MAARAKRVDEGESNARRTTETMKRPSWLRCCNNLPEKVRRRSRCDLCLRSNLTGYMLTRKVAVRLRIGSSMVYFKIRNTMLVPNLFGKGNHAPFFQKPACDHYQHWLSKEWACFVNTRIFHIYFFTNGTRMVWLVGSSHLSLPLSFVSHTSTVE